MSSAETMDHILRKTQLECIIPRVLNSRQLRTSLSLSGGLQDRREFIQGPYGMKVRNWIPMLGEAGLTCVYGWLPSSDLESGLEKQLQTRESWGNSLRSGSNGKPPMTPSLSVYACGCAYTLWKAFAHWNYVKVRTDQLTCMPTLSTQKV